MIYFDRKELEAWMKRNRQPTAEEAEQAAIAYIVRKEGGRWKGEKRRSVRPPTPYTKVAKSHVTSKHLRNFFYWCALKPHYWAVDELYQGKEAAMTQLQVLYDTFFERPQTMLDAHFATGILRTTVYNCYI